MVGGDAPVTVQLCQQLCAVIGCRPVGDWLIQGAVMVAVGRGCDLVVVWTIPPQAGPHQRAGRACWCDPILLRASLFRCWFSILCADVSNHGSAGIGPPAVQGSERGGRSRSGRQLRG